MRRFLRRLSIVPAAALLLASCEFAPTTSQEQAGMASIHTVAPRPAPLEPPPMLTDEAPPPKPKPLHQWDRPAPIVFSPEDEKVRASLPFTPAIAMDPIDGSKISIRANTPIFEHEGKFYYFSSEANKAQFASNPDAVLKGGLMKL